MIYQPVACNGAEDDLNRFAIDAATNLIPQAQLLSSKMAADSAHLLLRAASTLIAFDFYNRGLGEEAFEMVLRTAAELESKRKEQNDSLLKEIGIYVLAKDFSKDFLLRMSAGVTSVYLFEWSLIRSETQEAILIHQREEGAGYKGTRGLIDPFKPLQLFPQHSPPAQQLTTSELIAFARFGLELRDRCFKAAHSG